MDHLTIGHRLSDVWHRRYVVITGRGGGGYLIDFVVHAGASVFLATLVEAVQVTLAFGHLLHLLETLHLEALPVEPLHYLVEVQSFCHDDGGESKVLVVLNVLLF